MKQLNLQDTPRPHYVRNGEFKKRDNGFRFDGKVVFPSDDPTIADRGHVNVMHLFAAISNIGQLAAREELLLSNIRILSSHSGRYHREAPPNQLIGVSAEAEYLLRDRNCMRCDAMVTFRHAEKVLSRITVEFHSRRR